MNDNSLRLDPETMKQLGYQVVDMLVERLSDDSIPPLRRATADEMEQRLSGSAPAESQDFDQILRRLKEDVLPFTSRGDHPGFFAFIPFSGTWPGALGDFIASACNVFAGSWMEAAGPSRLELQVIDWFKSWVGYPQEAAGLLVSGGSAANLAALACARETLAGAMSPDLVAYVSDQAHSSMARAARHLGFAQSQLRVIPTDGSFRMRTDLLRSAMRADIRRNRIPFFVSASGGATNSGAVDPLREIHEVCRAQGAWFHVDAAYGGFAVLDERGRAQLAGLELANSITLDPHKWLYQPYECGSLLVRRGEHLRNAFVVTPDYLREAVALEREVNFSDLGMQLSRASRAFKIWVSIQYFGLNAFTRAIARTLDLAEHARRRIDESDVLELGTEPSLGVVCFRRRPREGEDEEVLNERLVSALEESGLGLVSSTRLHGRYTIRMCVLSHTTGQADVDRVLEFLERADVSDAEVDELARYERHQDVTLSAARGPARIAAPSRFVLLASLAPDVAEQIVARGQEREVPAGEVLVEQWDASQDFFLIRAGQVDVVADDERVAQLGPDEFFGEIAALDWGAGFGYPRTAEVVAATPLELLVYPDGQLQELVAEFPAVDRVIRAAIEYRLSVR